MLEVSPGGFITFTLYRTEN